jgi:hypothetical protein
VTALFADTFYWIALLDSNDSAHNSALALTQERIDSPLQAWNLLENILQ